MIRFIETEDTLSIRSVLLRDGKLAPHECLFPGDYDEGSFHLGYYSNDTLVSIATFHNQKININSPHIKPSSLLHMDLSGLFYQLRGMATLPEYRNQGFGNLIVNFGVTHLRKRKVDYLWCNARKKHLSFYEGLGFEFISEEFEIEEIGPHRTMFLKIA